MDKIAITDTYTKLALAKSNHYQAAEVALVHRQRLESAKLKALADGTIQGKNESEREAKAREVFEGEYNIQAQLDAGERYAKLALDLAWIEVEAMRALLRTEEIGAASLPTETSTFGGSAV